MGDPGQGFGGGVPVEKPDRDSVTERACPHQPLTRSLGGRNHAEEGIVVGKRLSSGDILLRADFGRLNLQPAPCEAVSRTANT
jgi:hypothetical protein